MNSATQRENVFPARLNAMREVRGFIESFCGDAEISHEPGLRLNLVIEELFTNTIKHGHRGDCDCLVWIALDARGGNVTLTYIDQAPAFNPFGIMGAPLEDSVEQRNVGGLGVLLATELSVTSEYARLFGRNRLRMALAR